MRPPHPPSYPSPGRGTTSAERWPFRRVQQFGLPRCVLATAYAMQPARLGSLIACSTRGGVSSGIALTDPTLAVRISQLSDESPATHTQRVLRGRRALLREVFTRTSHHSKRMFDVNRSAESFAATARQSARREAPLDNARLRSRDWCRHVVTRVVLGARRQIDAARNRGSVVTHRSAMAECTCPSRSSTIRPPARTGRRSY